MKLVEFGEPYAAEWQQRTLEDVIGDLHTLEEREVDRAERTGAKLYGNGRINRRYDMVAKARELLEQATRF